MSRLAPRDVVWPVTKIKEADSGSVIKGLVSMSRYLQRSFGVQNNDGGPYDELFNCFVRPVKGEEVTYKVKNVREELKAIIREHEDMITTTKGGWSSNIKQWIQTSTKPLVDAGYAKSIYNMIKPQWSHSSIPTPSCEPQDPSCVGEEDHIMWAPIKEDDFFVKIDKQCYKVHDLKRALLEKHEVPHSRAPFTPQQLDACLQLRQRSFPQGQVTQQTQSPPAVNFDEVLTKKSA